MKEWLYYYLLIYYSISYQHDQIACQILYDSKNLESWANFYIKETTRFSIVNINYTF